MANLVGAIAKVANQTMGAQAFVEIGFGLIVSESPLTMRIETGGKNLDLTYPDFLYVAQHLTDYEIPYNILSEEKATHPHKLATDFTEIREIDDFYVMHEGRQDVLVGSGLLGNFNGQGTIKLLNHLFMGNKVIWICLQGGSKYVIIDRIGEMDGDTTAS